MWKKKKRKWQLRQIQKQKRKNNKRKKGVVVAKKKTVDLGSQKRRIQKSFTAPEHLSLVRNGKETASYFSDIIKYLKSSEADNSIVYINLVNVKQLTVDAIMYLLAIICDFKDATERGISFVGNRPNHQDTNKLLQKSGFFKYVKSNVSDIQQNEDNTQIISGSVVDGRYAKEIIDFINIKCGTNRLFCQELYDVFIEMMNNTVQHAYDENRIMDARNWYLYADNRRDKISIVFLDTGVGIAETVNKAFKERVVDIRRKNDSYYVESALKGEFRSSSKEKNRGNGLPAIYNYAKRGEVNYFQIHSGRAICRVIKEGDLKNKDVEQPIFGVLYYWEIKKSEIDKEYFYDNSESI